MAAYVDKAGPPPRELVQGYRMRTYTALWFPGALGDQPEAFMRRLNHALQVEAAWRMFTDPALGYAWMARHNPELYELAMEVRAIRKQKANPK